MPQARHRTKEEILVSSARSRLSLVTSLGSARRGVDRCVKSVPVSSSGLLKVGAAAVAGAVLLRMAFSFRRSAKKAKPALPPPTPRSSGIGRQLLSETMLTLLLPLCRRYLLGENSPLAPRLDDSSRRER